MTTLIDILDTAVKIGFGALISGATTYWITKTKNDHEIKISKLQEGRSLVKDIAFHIESSTDLINDYYHILYTMDYDAVKNSNSNLMHARKEAYRAGAIANMLNLSDLSEAIYVFDGLLDDLHGVLGGITTPEEMCVPKTKKLTELINRQQGVIRPLITQAYSNYVA